MRLERPFARRRTPARMTQIECFARRPQMLENPINDRLLLDARNDLELAATAPTSLNLDRGHAL